MSENSEEIERLGRALAEAGRGRQGSRDCPEAATLWEAAAGELPPEEARRVAEHASRCSSCAGGYRLAVAIQRQASEPTGGGRESGMLRGLRQQANWRMAVAALLVVGFALGLWRFLQPPPSPHMRGFEKPEIAFSPALGEALPRDSFTLQWRLSAPARSYDVAVQADGAVVDRAANLREPRYTLPAAELEGLASGAPVVWLVTAHLENGRAPQYTHIVLLE